ncbi:C39 family peptidase [Secundilactobacillus yichangensis]|uniref:C39 family peptidase n=1 Tax=Secundilactobacillus yichangensis TaxID=2799580 RepID=UPI001943CE56|nr:C39 family peptidase [Secundilactobacillus yichangensis]
MRKLKVPLIPQRPELPTGCEITAVTMMLQYAGAQVNKVQLAKEMPYDTADCNKGFVGDPFTENGNSIYPPALMDLITKYAGHGTDLTGADLSTLKAQIDLDHPVVVWVGEFDGFHTHALTMIGYDDNAVIVNDCWTAKTEKLSNQQFAEIRAHLNNRAITI